MVEGDAAFVATLPDWLRRQARRGAQPGEERWMQLSRAFLPRRKVGAITAAVEMGAIATIRGVPLVRVKVG